MCVQSLRVSWCCPPPACCYTASASAESVMLGSHTRFHILMMDSDHRAGCTAFQFDVCPPFKQKTQCADATGSNSQAVTGTGMSARKLEEETEDFHGAVFHAIARAYFASLAKHDHLASLGTRCDALLLTSLDPRPRCGQSMVQCGHLTRRSSGIGASRSHGSH